MRQGISRFVHTFTSSPSKNTYPNIKVIFLLLINLRRYGRNIFYPIQANRTQQIFSTEPVIKLSDKKQIEPNKNKSQNKKQESKNFYVPIYVPKLNDEF